MPTSVVALQILLILLPGFAAAYLVQLVAVRARQSDLDKVIEALLFSFLIYLSSAALHHGDSAVAFTRTAQGDLIDFRPKHLWSLAILSALCALLMILYVQFDGTRIFRALKLTERSSRTSIWNDTFQDVRQSVDPKLGSIVQVELKDGRSVMGIVTYYSDSAEECSLFLKDAQWVGAESEDAVRINGPGILLTQNAEITSVSFLDPR